VLNTKSISGSLDYKKKAGKVDIVTSVRVSNAIQEGQLEGSSYFAAPQMTRIFMSPYQQIYNADGSLNTSLSTSVFNTVYLAENNISKLDGTRALSNTSLSYKITDNLKFQTRYSLDYNLTNSHRYQNAVHGGGVSDNGYAYQSNWKIIHLGIR
jgi:hypothetical protein